MKWKNGFSDIYIKLLRISNLHVSLTVYNILDKILYFRRTSEIDTFVTTDVLNW